MKREVVPDRNVLPKGICWTIPSMPWVLEFAGVQPNVGQGREREKKKRGTERQRKEPLVQQPEFVFFGPPESEKKDDTSAARQVDMDSREKME